MIDHRSEAGLGALLEKPEVFRGVKLCLGMPDQRKPRLRHGLEYLPFDQAQAEPDVAARFQVRRIGGRFDPALQVLTQRRERHPLEAHLVVTGYDWKFPADHAVNHVLLKSHILIHEQDVSTSGGQRIHHQGFSTLGNAGRIPLSQKNALLLAGEKSGLHEIQAEVRQTDIELGPTQAGSRKTNVQ